MSLLSAFGGIKSRIRSLVCLAIQWLMCFVAPAESLMKSRASSADAKCLLEQLEVGRSKIVSSLSEKPVCNGQGDWLGPPAFFEVSAIFAVR